MPSSIIESEKKYNSIEINEETVKRDLKLISNHNSFKKNKNLIFPTLILVGVIMIIIGIALYKKIGLLITFIMLGIISLGIGIFLMIKNNNKEKKLFIDEYLKCIDATYKIKYENDLGLSKIYPIIAKYDNELKIIEFIYNEQHIKVVYDDILNYTILEDDKDLDNDHVENINYNSNSYTLRITYNNKKYGNIIFNNNIKYFILNKDNKFLVDNNIETINNIKEILDKIIHKNII